eukprot:Rhum_TRINITY_DN14733_c4_g1::Rhum_TRINITY_DN14733_c4_g1_i3::g.113030::m.113030
MGGGGVGGKRDDASLNAALYRSSASEEGGVEQNNTLLPLPPSRRVFCFAFAVRSFLIRRSTWRDGGVGGGGERKTDGCVVLGVPTSFFWQSQRQNSNNTITIIRIKNSCFFFFFFFFFLHHKIVGERNDESRLGRTHARSSHYDAVLIFLLPLLLRRRVVRVRRRDVFVRHPGVRRRHSGQRQVVLTLHLLVLLHVTLYLLFLRPLRPPHLRRHRRHTHRHRPRQRRQPPHLRRADRGRRRRRRHRGRLPRRTPAVLHDRRREDARRRERRRGRRRVLLLVARLLERGQRQRQLLHVADAARPRGRGPAVAGRREERAAPRRRQRRAAATHARRVRHGRRQLQRRDERDAPGGAAARRAARRHHRRAAEPARRRERQPTPRREPRRVRLPRGGRGVGCGELLRGGEEVYERVDGRLALARRLRVEEHVLVHLLEAEDGLQLLQHRVVAALGVGDARLELRHDPVVLALLELQVQQVLRLPPDAHLLQAVLPQVQEATLQLGNHRLVHLGVRLRLALVLLGVFLEGTDGVRRVTEGAQLLAQVGAL